MQKQLNKREAMDLAREFKSVRNRLATIWQKGVENTNSITQITDIKAKQEANEYTAVKRGKEIILTKTKLPTDIVILNPSKVVQIVEIPYKNLKEMAYDLEVLWYDTETDANIIEINGVQITIEKGARATEKTLRKFLVNLLNYTKKNGSDTPEAMFYKKYKDYSFIPKESNFGGLTNQVIQEMAEGASVNVYDRIVNVAKKNNYSIKKIK